MLGAAGPGRTVLAVTVDDWLIDELAALGADSEDHEPEPDEDDGHLAPGHQSGRVLPQPAQPTRRGRLWANSGHELGATRGQTAVADIYSW